MLSQPQIKVVLDLGNKREKKSKKKYNSHHVTSFLAEAGKARS